jgi:4-amino-4-deoxy-L-arabinose transferase-like glycosyltransferase
VTGAQTGSFVTARTVIALMTTLQLLWVMGIWWSGTAPHPEKLLPLLLYSVIAAVVIDRLPRAALDGLKRLRRTVTQSSPRLWVLAGLLFLCGGGLYASAFPGWPDESHVFAAAKIVAEHGLGPFFHNYVQIPWLGRQHPPLVVLLYGFALRLCGTELIVIRMVSLCFALVTLGLTYRIASALSTRTIGMVAAMWLFCMPFFFRLAPAALTDMPVACCFVLAIFLTLRLLHQPSLWLATLVGISIGVGLLCKYTMVLVYPVILWAWVRSGRVRQLFPVFLVVFLVSLAIFSLWLGYAVHEGIFTNQQASLFRNARNVTATTRGRWWLLRVLAFRLPSGIGVAHLPLLAIGLWQMVCRRHWNDYFLLGWILAVALPLVLTLPGPRYFFPLFPALAIVMAYGLRHITGDAERVVLLALVFASASLYLFVDWPQAAGGLFTR